MTSISPFLWYDGRLDEAVVAYQALFDDVEVLESNRYPDQLPDVGGELMSVTVRLLGTQLMLFNGGPHYSLNPAFSLFVAVDDQGELDRLWDALLVDGTALQCGWLTDRFGLTWQIVPRQLGELLGSPEAGVAQRVQDAMMQMVKLDIAALEAAARPPALDPV